MSTLPRAYRQYDLLFTPRLIPYLRDLRGDEWTRLIDRLSSLPETHPDVLAFAMMMIDLGSCLTCEMDSYRAQRGCILCACQSITNFKENDKQLFNRYEKARLTVNSHLANGSLKKAA